MPTYISLLNWTDQGIRKVKETTERAEAFQAIAGKMKVKVRNIYWTMGDCDVVLIMEASDDETLSRLGNVKTKTLRAYSASEMGRILKGVA
jgi:uncharacterized protein with GYD domain